MNSRKSAAATQQKQGVPKWAWILCVALLVVLGALGCSLHYAAQVLKARVVQALGPGAEIGSIGLGWASVDIRQLRIAAPKGWPSADALRAESISLSPDWQALLSARIAIRRIEVDKPYLSIMRSPGGKLRLLPSLLEKTHAVAADGSAAAETDSAAPAQALLAALAQRWRQTDGPIGSAQAAETAEASIAASRPARAVDIGKIVLNDAAVDFYDTTVARTQSAYRIGLEQIHGTIENVRWPELKGNTHLNLQGLVKGIKQDGSFAIRGDLEIASKDSNIATELHGVDLRILEPYLIKAAEGGVKQGSMDLQVTSTIKQGKLHAPGTITLSKLELASNGHFMGLARQAATSALKDGHDDIMLKFTLDGDLNDPRFSLNENILARFRAGLAGAVGVNVGGLTSEVGKAAAGVGGTFKKLFGK